MKTRRELLKMTAGGLALAAPARAQSPPSPVAARIIDTHTHFFDPTRPQGVPWPSKGSPLDHPVYPKDWAAVAGPLGVRETVVVEASPLLEDNDWILNLAAKEKAITGFVGHLLPGSTDFAKELKRLAANPLFRGIRVSGNDLRDNIRGPDFVQGAKLMADMDLALDVNGLEELAAVGRLAEKVPALRIVLDHVGNAGDPKAPRPGWREGISSLGKQRNVVCKVSGLVEFNGPAYGQAPADPAYYLPVLDVVWETFGDDRLLFASNWPVSDKGTSYETLFKIVASFFTSKGGEACEKFFWKNALATYKCPERK